MSQSMKSKVINPDEVDPSVYYYDEVYDEMKNESNNEDEEANSSRGKSARDSTTKGSKYIQGLIESADQRKSEKEIRKFKKYARDRQAAEEKGELDETDVYITSTYKRRFEDIKRIDEEKRQQIASEDDRAMNFTRHNRDKRRGDSRASKSSQDVSQYKDLEKGTRKQDGQSEPMSSSAHTSDPHTHDSFSSLDESKDSIKRPRTIEERREFLRRVLAKRTVGKAFDDAVQRYKERLLARC